MAQVLMRCRSIPCRRGGEEGGKSTSRGKSRGNYKIFKLLLAVSHDQLGCREKSITAPNDQANGAKADPGADPGAAIRLC